MAPLRLNFKEDSQSNIALSQTTLEEPIEQNQQDYFIRHQSSQNEKGKHTP